MNTATIRTQYQRHKLNKEEANDLLRARLDVISIANLLIEHWGYSYGLEKKLDTCKNQALTPHVKDGTVYKEMLIKQAKETAEDLRNIANRIDREIERCPDEPDVIAQRIIHEIMWGLANLNLDGLLVKLMRIIEYKDD